MKKKKSTKKRKKGFNLKQEYKKSWDFIKESKNFIYIIIAIFFLFFLIAFIVPIPENIKNQILEFIKELIEKTEAMSQAELTTFIFINNFQSSFFGLILGFFFGIFPILSAIGNGYILGFVALMSIESEGILVLLRLFPHGIFELPAVFISLGLGLRFGVLIFQKKISFRDFIINSLRVLLFVIAPLLIIAAIIEGTIVFLG